MRSPDPDQDRKIDNAETYELPVAYFRLVDSRISDKPQADFPIWENDVFKIGRDPANTFAIRTDLENLVSRNHCEIYVIVYEESINHVYVRDRKSFNGTYVNGEHVGDAAQISSGYLLQDGDVIEIRPYWKFHFYQPRYPPPRQLTELQTQECRIFADKYLITERCLGTGAEASVHLAIEATTKKQLVCKVVKFGKQYGRASRKEVQRKLQEVDVLRQLRHPNILPYIDAIISPHSLYIFMELASGGDLISFINRHGTVAELDARIIMRQVTRGLSYLHRKGIVHRDLKPENILLAYSPKITHHRIMLSDFGACAVPRRSRMVTDIGTTEYKAPEMKSKLQSQTSAIDIWSLGLIALRVLTSNADDIEGLSHITQKSIESEVKAAMAQISPKLSSNSSKFVLDCLQVAPSDRMTAAEAEYHDWFCTPEKHVKHFKHLDDKLLEDWCDHEQLKPMPWDLLTLGLYKSCGSDLELEGCRPSMYGPTSQYFKAQGEDTDNAKLSGEVLQPRPEQNGDSKPSSLVCLEDTKGTPGTKKNHGLSSESSLCQQHETHSKIPRVVRIHDSVLVPKPGLDKYLQPMSTDDHREAILAELKRTNATFLADTRIGNVGTCAQDTN